MRPIDRIIIHHTATPDGEHHTIEEIDAWHAARGLHRDDYYRSRWFGALRAVGYHHCIYVNGACAAGRHHEEVGAHGRGYDAHSIGLAMVGNRRFSRPQWLALRELVDAINRRFPGAAILGHGELPGAKTPCPGFSVAAWLDGRLNPLQDHILDDAAARRAA